MPRYLTVLSILVWPSKLNGTQIAGPAIDQRCLCSSKGVGAEKVRVQPDAGNPLRQRAERTASLSCIVLARVGR